MGARLGAMTEVPITKQAIDFTDTIRGLFVHDMSSCIRDHVRHAIFVEKEQWENSNASKFQKSNTDVVPGSLYFTHENCKLSKLQGWQNVAPFLLRKYCLSHAKKGILIPIPAF